MNYVKDAPEDLIYKCDYGKIVNKTLDEAKHLFSCFHHAKVIACDNYCSCASEGMAAVAREYIDAASIAKALRLRPDQKITLAH